MKINKNFFWGPIFLLGYILFSSANWIIRKFGKVTYEQIMFHLNMPYTSERKMVISYIQNTFLTGLLILIGLFLLFYPLYPKCLSFFNPFRKKFFSYRFPLSLMWLFFCIGWFCVRMNVKDMIFYSQYEFEISNFYELFYSSPEEAKIAFPKNKKNLILIFAESMEATYAQSPSHNYFGKNLIPELSNLANKYINFSHDSYIGGSFQIDGTQWTQAGLFSQTCGVPIQLPINNANWFHPANGFFPKAYCLYDILKKEGYLESFLIGSSGSFAGMDKFVETHGKQHLLDVNYIAKKEGFLTSFKNTTKIPDKKLFQYAKEELLKLNKENKPFVFTVMTLDSHYGTHHFEESECVYQFGKEKNIENVISCADHQITKFITWIMQQDFYKNSVIIVLGDHLTMNNRFTEDMDRKPLNIFINSPRKAFHIKNRIFTPFDIYPTIIESMGIDIKDHRLGLGTSLYSDIPTLTEEKMTIQEMDINVRKKSKIYDYLLYGKNVYP